MFYEMEKTNLVADLPIKLGRDPIMEAVFEIRFQSDIATLSELLPGLLYTQFNSEFGTPERLFAADLPPELLESDPNLRYQPRLRMKGDRFAILIGDRSIIVSCSRPYSGWAEFRPVIFQVLDTLKRTNLIKVIERISLKYVNVLSAETLDEQFRLIQFKSTVGRHDLTTCISTTAFEFIEDGLNNLIEIKSNASVRLPDGKTEKGLFISVDTINLAPRNFWDEQERHVDTVHQKEKEIFFGLLAEETISKLDPVWK